METLGYRLLAADAEHAVAELPFSDATAQLTGLFHTGALLALADSTATYLCLQNVYPGGAIDDPARFPLAIQISANLVRNTNRGSAFAEARLRHRGRTTLVVETHVRDGEDRTLAIVTTTHLVLGSPAS
ncbi:MAG TPA: PaaI family thioesterase [Dehalococcoidia bacterium]|nr:PaaI family thioesterase [Dehalococcoidia bacterium]